MADDYDSPSSTTQLHSSRAQRDIDTVVSSHTPLLHSDLRRIDHASSDSISRFLSPDLAHVRRSLQWFLTSKYGHYVVIVLVSLDVAGIFADFLISLHICENTPCGGAGAGAGGNANLEFWQRFDDALDVVSLVFSSLFMVELVLSLFAFGLGYFKSLFHIIDGLSIIASFLVDVLLHGPLEEAGSLVIVLRLFRVFKIIEESGTAAEESLEQMQEKIENLEKENNELRRRQSRGDDSLGGQGYGTVDEN